MTTDEEEFIRTPLSSNGFYRIHPDGQRRWEEFVPVAVTTLDGTLNRLAAFTDDELYRLCDLSERDPLQDEIDAELERRQT